MPINVDDFSDNQKDIYFPFFDLLTEDEIELIKTNSNVVHYQKKSNIFLQHTRTSHVMYVKSGLVKVYKEGRMGKSIILSLETDNSFLGLMSVFGKETHEFSASSVDPTEILIIDNNAFRTVLNKNGIFA